MAQTYYNMYILNSQSATVSSAIEIDLDGKCTGFNDHVVYGTITDNAATPNPIEGALVRATRTDTGAVLGYAYSGCNGDYMIAVAEASWPASGSILIEVVGSDNTHVPEECAT